MAAENLGRSATGLACAAWMLAGCGSVPSYFVEHPAGVHGAPVSAHAAADTKADPRRLPMFAGPEMTPIGWSELLRACAWADVIILGEQHDDALGHFVQRAVTEDVVARWPGSALSLEMLERDEQALADDYVEGLIDAQTLASLTHSQNWGAAGMWDEWYQPIIDAAKQRGGRIVAANAPRRYVRLARTAGYERLRQLPRERRRLFSLPEAMNDERYFDRFVEVMSTHDASATQPATQPQPPRLSEMEPESHRAGFRSQLLWDATMADSITRALKSGAPKVVHLVGQFHSNFNGGTVQQVRARAPRAKVLVISMEAETAEFPTADDRGRADILIHTFVPEAVDLTTQPASQPALDSD